MPKKNTQFYCSAMLVSVTDGSAVTSGTTTVYVLKGNGTQAESSNAATHKGNGVWQVLLTLTEMNADVVNVTFVNSSAVSANIQIVTDSSTNADLATTLTDILADTAELQTNQDNWITATGFSTHSAADVKTAIEQAGSSIAQILADTSELQTDWANGGRLDVILDASANATTILPVASTVSAGEVTEQELTLYLDTAGTFTIAVFDSAGDPIDLSGVSSMRFVAYYENDARTTLFSLDENDITIGGVDDNQAAITYAEADTATEGTFRYNFRDEDTPRLLAHGALNIVYTKDLT